MLPLELVNGRLLKKSGLVKKHDHCFTITTVFGFFIFDITEHTPICRNFIVYEKWQT